MIQLDIPDDVVQGMQTVTPDQARLAIESANEERDREAEEANEGGDMDDFRYLSQPWFVMETQVGKFVASIKRCGGGGRVSNPPDSEDFDSSFIEYNLHFRIIEEHAEAA